MQRRNSGSTYHAHFAVSLPYRVSRGLPGGAHHRVSGRFEFDGLSPSGAGSDREMEGNSRTMAD